MVTYSIHDKPRLRRYINSKGFDLPKDYIHYKPDRDRGRLCLFCNAEIDPIKAQEVMQYSSGGRAVGTETKCCNICFEPIKRMEEAYSRDHRNTLFSENIEYRLHSYVYSGVFDPTICLHFAHGGKDWSKCYFCKRTVNSPQGKVYYAPADVGTYITGGRFQVCATCHDLVITSTPEVDEETATLNLGLEKERCRCCEELYPVTKAEYQSRRQIWTNISHVCPSCAVNQHIDKNLNSSLLVQNPPIQTLLTPKRYEDGEFLRYRYEHCEYCGNNVDIDVCLHWPVILSHHYSQRGYIVCGRCIGPKGTGPAYSFTKGPFVWLAFMLDNGQFEVRIYGHANKLISCYAWSGKEPVRLFDAAEREIDAHQKEYTLFD